MSSGYLVKDFGVVVVVGVITGNMVSTSGPIK